jgi:Tfp pilus assembly protein PilF
MPQNGIQAFQQAVGLAPDVPYFHLNLARLYEQVGNQKKADEHYEQYKQLKPDEEPP